MGGVVKVIIRKEDGTVQSMTRWTNNLSWLIHTPDCFIGTDNDSFRRYMKTHDDMQADYEAHKHDGKFKFVTTVSYFFNGWDSIAPEDYGIVVMDYKTKTLISSQGYTGPSAFMFSEAVNTNRGIIYVPDFSVGTYNEDELKTHLAKGDILSLKCRFIKGEDEKILSMLGVSTIDDFTQKLTIFLESLQWAKTAKISDLKPISISFNRHGFESFFYENVFQVKDKMQELGFIIPDKDIPKWMIYDEES